MEDESSPYYFKHNPNYPDGTDQSNPIIIYTDGVFDVFHYGHARLFEKIKRMFPHVYLIVGVCKDEDIIAEKGPPILDLSQRIESVMHCKWTDRVEIAPWIPTCEFLDKIGAHYIAHDPEPYPYKDQKDVYSSIKEVNRFIPTTRTEGISTTDIILKIIEDYDTYIERSLKKKVPIESLHLSATKWLKYKSEGIENSIKNKLLAIAENIYSEDKSKVLIKEFLDNKK